MEHVSRRTFEDAAGARVAYGAHKVPLASSWGGTLCSERWLCNWEHGRLLKTNAWCGVGRARSYLVVQSSTWSTDVCRQHKDSSGDSGAAALRHVQFVRCPLHPHEQRGVRAAGRTVYPYGALCPASKTPDILPGPRSRFSQARLGSTLYNYVELQERMYKPRATCCALAEILLVSSAPSYNYH